MQCCCANCRSLIRIAWLWFTTKCRRSICRARLSPAPALPRLQPPDRRVRIDRGFRYTKLQSHRREHARNVCRRARYRDVLPDARDQSGGGPLLHSRRRQVWQRARRGVEHGVVETAFQFQHSALNSSIQLNGDYYQLVGVAPEGIEEIYPNVDLWMPMAFSPRELSEERRGSLVLHDARAVEIGNHAFSTRRTS